MKKIFSFLTILVLFLPSTLVFAATNKTATASVTSSNATWKVDHFEVATNPSSTKVWEAVDLTIKAVDSSWNQIKDYLWTIYITVDNDTKATVPYSDWYQFLAADLWSKTFSKWLSFTKEWKMKVVVMDIDNENLEGNVDVDVNTTTSTTTSSWEITITSPDNGVIIADSKVTVSWTTKKNSKVQYFLNLKKVYENQTDNDWGFSYELTWLNQSENIISVKVLDSSDSVIAESDKITVKQDMAWPIFKNISVKEWKQVALWSNINIEVMSDPGLSEVSATLWDANQILTEWSAWSYTWVIKVPNEAWDYNINLSLKSTLWKVTTKNNAFSIKVSDLNNFKDIKSQIWDKKVMFTFALKNDKPEISKFKFIYWTWANFLTSNIITFEKDKIKNSSWALSWYIPNLSVNKYFFQIIPLDWSGSELSWKSDIVDVDLSLPSAWKCTISNIWWLKVSSTWDISELSWNPAIEATSYNVYRKWADGIFSLIENVKTNKYEVNISWDKLKYEDFAVKWICWDLNNQNESPDYSNVTKVQTGPAQIIALILTSFVLWFLYMKRKRFN